MKFRVSAVVVALLIFVPPMFSQALPPAGNRLAMGQRAPLGPFVLNMKKEVQEVNLVLSVTDRRGHFVQGLAPADLAIFDNDKLQTTLTYFQSQIDRRPLHGRAGNDQRVFEAGHDAARLR